VEAGMQAGERLSEVAEERGLTKEGLKEAARDVGETFSSALAADDTQALDRKHSSERVRPKSAPPQQAQSGATNTQSSKSSRAPSSDATPPSGGRT
jgi:hypothetical protein